MFSSSNFIKAFSPFFLIFENFFFFLLKHSCYRVLYIDMYDVVIHNFKGYIPFIVTIKYWLYSPCCMIYPCTLLYV